MNFGLLSKFRAGKPLSQEEEIVEHIADLLNSKASFSAYDKALGLDSYFYIGSASEIIKQLMKDISSCLATFETRIRVVDILCVPNETSLQLAFVIKCKIGQSERRVHLSFHHQQKLFSVEARS